LEIQLSQKSIWLEYITKGLNSRPFNYTCKKVYIENYEAIQTDVNYNIKHIDMEITLKTRMYQYSKGKYTYTLGFKVPEVYYNGNPDRFDNLIYNYLFIK